MAAKSLIPQRQGLPVQVMQNSINLQFEIVLNSKEKLLPFHFVSSHLHCIMSFSEALNVTMTFGSRIPPCFLLGSHLKSSMLFPLTTGLSVGNI